MFILLDFQPSDFVGMPEAPELGFLTIGDRQNPVSNGIIPKNHPAIASV